MTGTEVLFQTNHRAFPAGVLRDSIGYELEPAEQKFREAYLADLRAALGEAVLADLFEPGGQIHLAEAAALALEEAKA